MKKYKLAVDIGTTNIEFAVLDGTRIVSTKSFRNPQYGRDVINRILVCTRDKSHIRLLKGMLVSELIKNIDDIYINSLDKICICGNTTMISILLEYDIEELGCYPFKHKLDKSVITDSVTLFGETFPSMCPVILSGCASAFIGGDVLAGLVAICEDEIKAGCSADNTGNKSSIYDNVLFMDLGTNGELVLISNGKFYATSAACGPVFEGCARKVNAYGSTVIDAIAMYIKSGRMDRQNPWGSREIGYGVNVMGVGLDAVLVQEIATAKAAIYVGVEYLLDKAGISFGQISRVYIAGGFGFHLNLENATYIGLIPEAFRGKIQVVGNTSLKGAIKLLNHNEAVELLNSLTSSTDKIQIIQMANEIDYQDKLMSRINFCET